MNQALIPFNGEKKATTQASNDRKRVEVSAKTGTKSKNPV